MYIILSSLIAKAYFQRNILRDEMISSRRYFALPPANARQQGDTG